MKFENKIKMRIFTSVLLLIIGIFFIVSYNINIITDEITSSFGAIFAVIGLTKSIRYIMLLNNKNAMKKREVAETDERNLMIITKARSISSGIYIGISGIIMIVCYITGHSNEGRLIAYMICAFMIIYLICYGIINKFNS